MPFGNGGPRGLPDVDRWSHPVTKYAYPSPFTVYTTSPGGGAAEPYDTAAAIAPLSSVGPLDAYGQAVAATPGLQAWWRGDATMTGGAFGSNLVYLNSVGAGALYAPAGGISLTTGLVPGSRSKGFLFNGSGYLVAFDYNIYAANSEAFTLECWAYQPSLVADTCFLGNWSTSGFMFYQTTSGVLNLYSGGTAISSPSGALVAGGVQHLVGVCQGTDHIWRLFVNGIQVATAAPPGSAPNVQAASSVRFQVGAYSTPTGGGGKFPAGTVIDELAIYSRGLQPEEIVQHYNAAFARG